MLGTPEDVRAEVMRDIAGNSLQDPRERTI